jgi:hypothetical protein
VQGTAAQGGHVLEAGVYAGLELGDAQAVAGLRSLHCAVGLGRDPDDFEDAEIGGSEFLEPANDLVGVRAAGAGMLLAELIPGEVQGFVEAIFADAGQALGLRSRAVVRNEAQGLSPADPGAQVECGDRINVCVGVGSIIHVGS